MVLGEPCKRILFFVFALCLGFGVYYGQDMQRCAATYPVNKSIGDLHKSSFSFLWFGSTFHFSEVRRHTTSVFHLQIHLQILQSWLFLRWQSFVMLAMPVCSACFGKEGSCP